MKRYIFALLLTSLTSGFCFGQIVPTGIRDTSFSVNGSYRNEKRAHPDMTIADSTMPVGVQVFKNIIYKKYPKRSLYLDVYRKKEAASKSEPAVLMVFGGGWRSGDRTHNYTLARQLASRGFVTITADYSLSTDALYPAAVHDLKMALKWLRAHSSEYGIDTARIAILGFSAGGQLAALVGTTNGDPTFESGDDYQKYSSTVQAIVDIDGTLAFIHPESGEGDDSRSISAATNWFGYSKTQKPALWEQAAPLNHAGKTTPPILFLNSSVARMHAGRDDMVKKLNALGIYSEIHSFPEAPHTFMFFEPWFTPTLNYTSDFLKKILAGE
ncbi:MAG: alpha/beta hydrolase [Dyadobacter sp.]|uniref:alpha/beta hydrolase n=1 Tax=Dyadobacter sp. TaxID=1914288 RepID=UPI003263BD9F